MLAGDDREEMGSPCFRYCPVGVFLRGNGLTGSQEIFYLHGTNFCIKEKVISYKTTVCRTEGTPKSTPTKIWKLISYFFYKVVLWDLSPVAYELFFSLWCTTLLCDWSGIGTSIRNRSQSHEEHHTLALEVGEPSLISENIPT